MTVLEKALTWLGRRPGQAMPVRDGWCSYWRLLPATLQEGVRLPFRLGAGSLSFLVLVVLPTIAAGSYLGFIASDEYVSQAELVIRSPSESRLQQLSFNFQSFASALAGPKAATQDAYVVVGYIRGRTVIDDLGGREALRPIYSKNDIDWLSRLEPESAVEDVWKYWQRKVSAVLDVPSGIVTLEVRAFARRDAFDLATRLVDAAEKLVNQISERARADTLRHAETELEEAKHKVDDRLEALMTYRNKQELLDPMMTASSIGETATKLLHEKFRIENQIAVMRQASVSPDAPTMHGLRAQLASVDEQIHKLETQLASDSPGRRVLASQLAGYERLQLELKFSEKLYEIAENAYKQAALEAQRQQLYVVSIVRPTMPQAAAYPRPFLDSLLVFVWLTVLWAIAALTIAGVREHR